jgi:tRNA(adenine34) deaminase
MSDNLITELDIAFLRRTFDLAKSARDKGNMPFGAIFATPGGHLLAEAENSTVVDKDIASHAEINAIRRICTNGGQASLAGATAYTNCSPCPMCFGAMIRYGVSKLVYGTDYLNLNGAALPASSVAYGASLTKMAESAYQPTQVLGPYLEDEAKLSLLGREERN